MNLLEIKDKVLSGELDTGVYASKNEADERLVLTVSSKTKFSISKKDEDNICIEVRVYTYENNSWIENTTYELAN